MSKVSAPYGQRWELTFACDENSPTGLRWVVDTCRGAFAKESIMIPKGSIAGRLHRLGYYWVRTNRYTGTQVAYSVHRIVWEIHNGPVPAGYLVDHIDGNRMNNTVENLRLVTKAENARNMRMFNTNSTGKTGVGTTTIPTGSGGCNYYFNAHWVELDGTKRQKCFNIEKLGLMVAFRNACAFRDDQVARLNTYGAGYTDRHGVLTN